MLAIPPLPVTEVSRACGRRSIRACRRTHLDNENLPVIPGTCDQARCGDIDWAATRQHLPPPRRPQDGEWHQQGEMGWFGCVAAKANAAWEAEVDALLAVAHLTDIIAALRATLAINSADRAR